MSPSLEDVLIVFSDECTKANKNTFFPSALNVSTTEPKREIHAPHSWAHVWFLGVPSFLTKAAVSAVPNNPAGVHPHA